MRSKGRFGGGRQGLSLYPYYVYPGLVRYFELLYFRLFGSVREKEKRRKREKREGRKESSKSVIICEIWDCPWVDFV